MRTNWKGSIILIFVSTLFLINCAAKHTNVQYETADLQTRWGDRKYVPKVDHFLILTDVSGSMRIEHRGVKKYEIAREFLLSLNESLPEMDVEGGMRIFGRTRTFAKQETMLVYGMTQYSREAFGQSISRLDNAKGSTPMADVLTAVRKDLAATVGKTALIIVSDGKPSKKSPIPPAKDLMAEFGDRLCLYTVLIGDDPEGRATMDQLAALSGCGRSFTAADLENSRQMGDFAENVFFTPAPLVAAAPIVVAAALDSDGDGVTDGLDRCPNTPAGVAVDNRGCPLDSDGDGVLDYSDRCPGTPAGAQVNEVGCWVLGDVMFESGKADLKPVALPDLNSVVDILNRNPDLKIEIQGHTDNRGSSAFNQQLSEKRAKSVQNHLVQADIDPGRVSAVGFGETDPVAPNDTSAGRKANRRVELNPIN